MAVIKQSDEYIYTRENGHTERSGLVVAYPPENLLTNQGGANARLRVDVAQTGFFDGREFRAFHKFTIADGATRVYRFTAASDFIIFDNSVILDDGYVWYEFVSGGTAGGTFTDLASYRRNSLSAAMSRQSAPLIVDGSLWMATQRNRSSALRRRRGRISRSTASARNARSAHSSRLAASIR